MEGILWLFLSAVNPHSLHGSASLPPFRTPPMLCLPDHLCLCIALRRAAHSWMVWYECVCEPTALRPVATITLANLHKTIIKYIVTTEVCAPLRLPIAKPTCAYPLCRRLLKIRGHLCASLRDRSRRRNLPSASADPTGRSGWAVSAVLSGLVSRHKKEKRVAQTY